MLLQLGLVYVFVQCIGDFVDFFFLWVIVIVVGLCEQYVYYQQCGIYVGQFDLVVVLVVLLYVQEVVVEVFVIVFVGVLWFYWQVVEEFQCQQGVVYCLGVVDLVIFDVDWIGGQCVFY